MEIGDCDIICLSGDGNRNDNKKINKIRVLINEWENEHNELVDYETSK